MKDFVTAAAIAGTGSFLFKNITNHILHYLGVTPFLYRRQAASLVLPLDAANTISGIIVGLFTDLVLLIWVALAIAYLLQLTGYTNFLIKGAFVGASSWLLLYGLFSHNNIMQLAQPLETTSGITSISFDLISGAISAAILFYLSEKKL